MTIALVQYSGAGDHFEQWAKGAQQQADAVGFTLQLHDAQADDAGQAADMHRELSLSHRYGDSPQAGICPASSAAIRSSNPAASHDRLRLDCESASRTPAASSCAIAS